MKLSCGLRLLGWIRGSVATGCHNSSGDQVARLNLGRLDPGIGQVLELLRKQLTELGGQLPKIDVHLVVDHAVLIDELGVLLGRGPQSALLVGRPLDALQRIRSGNSSSAPWPTGR